MFQIESIRIIQRKDRFERPLQKWDWLVSGTWRESGKKAEYSSRANNKPLPSPQLAAIDLARFLSKLTPE